MGEYRGAAAAAVRRIVASGQQFRLALAILLLGSMALAGCSSRDPFAGTPSPMYKGSGPLPKGGGRYVVGDPYQVAGRTYYPREDPNYDKVGTASWYGPSFHRRMTSNGEWFDMHYLSAAHPTLPLPSYVRVTNLENRRTIVVRVNDRGPFVGTRLIDLSKKSADALGFRSKGTAKVRVTYLGRAPLNDKGSHLMAMNRSLKNGEPVTQFAAAEKPRKAVAAKPKKVEQTDVAAFEPQDEVEDRPVATAAPAAGYFVQVASYSDPANAGRTKSNLAGLGHVVITPVEADLGTFYRVRVGPLASPEEASMTLARIRAAGHYDARVVAQN